MKITKLIKFEITPPQFCVIKATVCSDKIPEQPQKRSVYSHYREWVSSQRCQYSVCSCYLVERLEIQQKIYGAESSGIEYKRETGKFQLRNIKLIMCQTAERYGYDISGYSNNGCFFNCPLCLCQPFVVHPFADSIEWQREQPLPDIKRQIDLGICDSQPNYKRNDKNNVFSLTVLSQK